MTPEEVMFEHFLATSQIQCLDKIHMLGRGLFKEHFCKTFVKIYAVRQQINANFCFSDYGSMATISCLMATRVIIQLEQKTQLFVPPAYRCYM